MSQDVNVLTRQIGSDVRAAALTAMAGWVAAIADRFTNPIAGMMAALAVIEQHAVMDPIAKDSTQRLRARLLVLGDFVQELVDFAKPAILQPRRLELLSLFPLLERDFRDHTPGHCEFEMSVDYDAEFVWADPDKLSFVLRALLENAVEAMPPPSIPRVRLTASAAATPDWIEIAVEDAGPGFMQELQLIATEAFVTTKDAGTGLGLAIAKKYVEAHGGSLSLGRSADMGGACVRLLLPAA